MGGRIIRLASRIKLKNHIGLTNGNGVTIGKGITNGNGLTNGNVVTTGKGITNGNGLTNGNGVTINSINYFRDRKARQIELIKTKHTKAKIASVIITLFVLTIPIIALFMELDIGERDIMIDGNFNDWSKVTSYQDSAIDQSNDNVNIIDYRVIDSDGRLSCYLEVKGEILKGEEVEEKTSNDVINIFIDNDKNKNSGYSVDNIGADYMLEISGYNGQVQDAICYVFDRIEDNVNNWNGWTSIYTVNAETNDNKLETEVGSYVFSGDNKNGIDVSFHIKDAGQREDFSDNIVNTKSPALIIQETVIAPEMVEIGESNIPFLKLDLTARANNVILEDIGILITGTVETSDILNVNLFNDEDSNGIYTDNDLLIMTIDEPQLSKSNILANFDFNNEIELIQDETITYFVTLDFASNENMYNAVGAKVDRKSTTSTGTLTVNSAIPIGCKAPSTYIGGIPDEIIIDGAFADWNVVKNYADSDEQDITNANVDINEFRITQDDEELSFYFSVTGTMMGGSTVPIKPLFSATDITLQELFKDTDSDEVPDIYDPNPYSNIDTDNDGWSDDYEKVTSGTDWTNPDSDGDNVPDKDDLAPLDENISWESFSSIISLPIIRGQDTAHIFIDSDKDPNTGYNPLELPIGADYMLEISGKYGYIFENGYYEFKGEIRNEWNWSYIDEICVGTDAARLETQISLNELGISSNTEVDIFFHTTDWGNLIEDTSNCAISNLEDIQDIASTDDNPKEISFIRSPSGNNVVINEIYPDNKVEEWIELYNPTSSSIDLSNWKIEVHGSGQFGKKEYNIPSGVSIGPLQFLVFDCDDFGFDFIYEKHTTVTLYNSFNVIIDKTTYNKQKPGYSWARDVDGVDTDSKQDWHKESQPTEGSSNNPLWIPEYQNLLLPLVMVLLIFVILRRFNKFNNLELRIKPLKKY